MTPLPNGLIQKVNEANDINKIFALLNWDKETQMPQGGLNGKIRHMTTLRKIEHEILTSEEMCRLLEQAIQQNHEEGSFEYYLVKHLTKKLNDERKLSTDFLVRATKASGKAHAAWAEARQQNDYCLFSEHLSQMISLCREKADLLGYEGHMYTALLDQYEPGMQNEEIEEVFKNLKPELIQILKVIKNSDTFIDNTILLKDYGIEKQKVFAKYISNAIGFDFNRGNLSTVLHPFCTKISENDVRITTRWDKNFISMSIFGTLHESGHGIYEQNISSHLAASYLDSGTSMGIHESQSRLYENVVGRNPHFWEKHFSVLQKLFPQQLSINQLQDFTNAINKVTPSLIRVEADEVTYNLHILLRYELEKNMLSLNLKAKDLPEAWNEKMKKYLGIKPENDAQGCLQDVHWTRPGFGYFPTYTLGNLNASTIYNCAVTEKPEITSEIKLGETSTLKEWLRLNIHQYGKSLSAKEILQKIGVKTNHEDFISYVKNKFQKIYNIKSWG